jgi:hypothetical protein
MKAVFAATTSSSDHHFSKHSSYSDKHIALLKGVQAKIESDIDKLK